MKVVITGGAGFIGSHIADCLSQAGFKVKIFDNFSSGSKKNIPEFDIARGDIRNFSALLKAFRGADYIIHNAALISVPKSFQKPSEYHDVNVKGTLNVLLAAKQQKIKKVIFASSAAVYGNGKIPNKENAELDSLSIYALNKIEAEQYFKFFNDCYGLNTVVLRYFNIFGPRQSPDSAYAAAIPIFIKRFLSGQKAVIFGDGKQTRDFLYVKNVAKANLLALKSKKANGKTLNIASGKRISINNLVSSISPELKFEHAAQRKGDIKHSCADISLSKRIIGNYEDYSFQEGLNETIEWYENH
jgi:nucleoside-diphosphate-sugar epimerase